jgi:hypothetical protein
VDAVIGNRVIRGRPSRWRGLFVVLALLLIAPQAAFSAKLVSREYQLKAAFVYNFTKFIEWPAQSFSSAEAPIVIGVLGDGAFGPQLGELVKDRSVNGRGIVVTRVENAEQARAAHVLFVSADELGLFNEMRPLIQDSPVLTIGESRSFALRHGVINFVMEDNIPRFEIYMGSARRAGLRISAQLQKLAKIVFEE